jgi:hypothetical protein
MTWSPHPGNQQGWPLPGFSSTTVTVKRYETRDEANRVLDEVYAAEQSKTGVLAFEAALKS